MLVHGEERDCVGIDRCQSGAARSLSTKEEPWGYETGCGWCSELWTAGRSLLVVLRKGIAFELLSVELGFCER